MNIKNIHLKMEAIEFIKKYNKEFIGHINENIVDMYGYNYYHYLGIINIKKLVEHEYLKKFKKVYRRDFKNGIDKSLYLNILIDIFENGVDNIFKYSNYSIDVYEIFEYYIKLVDKYQLTTYFDSIRKIILYHMFHLYDYFYSEEEQRDASGQLFNTWINTTDIKYYFDDGDENNFKDLKTLYEDELVVFEKTIKCKSLKMFIILERMVAIYKMLKKYGEVDRSPMVDVINVINEEYNVSFDEEENGFVFDDSDFVFDNGNDDLLDTYLNIVEEINYSMDEMDEDYEMEEDEDSIEDDSIDDDEIDDKFEDIEI